MPQTICPECATGKHQNCDGVADITDFYLVPCYCEEGSHPLRPITDRDAEGD